MERAITRRHVLNTSAAVLGAAWGGSSISRAQQTPIRSSFAPNVNGFGFRNWSSQDQYFDPPPPPTQSDIVTSVRSGWQHQAETTIDADLTRFPNQLIAAIATQLRMALVQQAGTNGHCYGMVLTAQEYYERPDSIPVNRHVAAEIEHPTVPVEEPSAPVYDTIVQRQAEQYLKFKSWLGRRAMFRPEWIDTERVLDDVQSVIDETGTATLTLFDDRLHGHQVLAYAYSEHAGSIAIPIYDPNRIAQTYRGSVPTLSFDRDDGTLTMQPYGRYTRLLFNQYDQIERATGRPRVTPLDHLTVDRSALRDSLFPLAVITVDTPDVHLTVTDPHDEEIERIRGTYMDRSRTDHAAIRSVHGAEAGTYRIGVFGIEPTEYTVSVIAADTDRTIIDTTRTGRIGVGVLHEYELVIPNANEGTFTSDDRDATRQALVASAGIVSGLIIGAAGHRTIKRMRNTTRSNQPATNDHE